MISFVLVLVSWKALAIAALVAVVIGWVWHSQYVFGRFCQHKHDGCCDKKQACAPGQPCPPNYGAVKQYDDMGYPSIEKHDYCCRDCNYMCMALYKLFAFALAFVQAYGIAFLIERFDLLLNYRDAISLTLFVALTFLVTHMIACAVWHKKSWIAAFSKIACRLVIVSAMAAVIVYFA